MSCHCQDTHLRYAAAPLRSGKMRTTNPNVFIMQSARRGGLIELNMLNAHCILNIYHFRFGEFAKFSIQFVTFNVPFDK